MIYLNPASSLTGVELYTTLAHEGFPGHLYQTNYFAQNSHAPIRHLLNMGRLYRGMGDLYESYAYNYRRPGVRFGAPPVAEPFHESLPVLAPWTSAYTITGGL